MPVCTPLRMVNSPHSVAHLESGHKGLPVCSPQTALPKCEASSPLQAL
jgi:hypothetical protein